MGKIIEVDNARITYRNFSGAERDYNKKGNRNFVLILDEEGARPFIEEGIHVRTRPSREYEGVDEYLVKINVNLESMNPPMIMMIGRQNKRQLTADTVSLLDSADIRHTDLVINVYRRYSDDRKSVRSVTAYLSEMYATVFESKYADKYRNVQNSEDEDFED